MAALALPLGGFFRSMPPLRAYAIDIIGSLTGIAAFTAMSFLGIGPVGWTLVVIAPGRAARLVAGDHAVVGRLGRCDGRLPVRRADVDRHLVAVPAADRPGPGRIRRHPRQRHSRTRRFRSPTCRSGSTTGRSTTGIPGHTFDDVLIIGAGSGNDTATALRRGDGHIDAVEIDPAILKLGVGPQRDASIPGPARDPNGRGRTRLPASVRQEVRPDPPRPDRTRSRSCRRPATSASSRSCSRRRRSPTFATT